MNSTKQPKQVRDRSAMAAARPVIAFRSPRPRSSNAQIQRIADKMQRMSPGFVSWVEGLCDLALRRSQKTNTLPAGNIGKPVIDIERDPRREGA